MKSIITDTINIGRFDLNALSRKINQLWIEGVLTDTDRDELLTQAQAKADPHQSYGTWQDTADGIMAAIQALTLCVEALEAGTPEAPPEGDEWPEFVQPTGAHDDYGLGDKITYEGKRYISLQAINAYSPAAYPPGWELQS